MIYPVSLSACVSFYLPMNSVGDSEEFFIPDSSFYLLALLIIMKDFIAIKMATIVMYKTKKGVQILPPK
jgi:hypothetical protein